MDDDVIWRKTRRGKVYTATNPVDQETLMGKIVAPVYRPGAAPRHPNPIRRFREELRLDRTGFAKLLGVPMETSRSWERPKPVMPKSQTIMRMVDIARTNYYPLRLEDIWKFYGI